MSQLTHGATEAAGRLRSMRKMLFIAILYVTESCCTNMWTMHSWSFVLYNELYLDIFPQCNVYISQLDFPKLRNCYRNKASNILPSPLISLAFGVQPMIFLGTTPKNQSPNRP